MCISTMRLECTAAGLNGNVLVTLGVQNAITPYYHTEYQLLMITGSPTGGNIKISCVETGLTTGAIAYNASNATLATELNTIVSGTIQALEGNMSPTGRVVLRWTTPDDTDMETLVIAENNLTGGTSPAAAMLPTRDGEVETSKLRQITVTETTATDVLTIADDGLGGYRFCDIDSSGNLYHFGGSTLNPTFKSVAKYNSLGTLQWSLTGVNARSGCHDGSGGVAYPTGSGGEIRKLSSSGSLSWTYTHDASAITYAVARGGSDFYFVSSHPSTTSPTHVGKLNGSGTLQWSARHGSSSTYDLYCVSVNTTADRVVVGGQLANDTKNIRCYDLAGTLQWSARLGTSVASVMCIDVNDSGEVVAGGTRDTSGVIAAKFDSSGTEEWTVETDEEYDFTAFDTGRPCSAIRFLGSGHVLVGCYPHMRLTDPDDGLRNSSLVLLDVTDGSVVKSWPYGGGVVDIHVGI